MKAFRKLKRDWRFMKINFVETELELDGQLEAINACYVLATKLAKEMAIGFQKHLNPKSSIGERKYNEYRLGRDTKIKT